MSAASPSLMTRHLPLKVAAAFVIFASLCSCLLWKFYLLERAPNDFTAYYAAGIALQRDANPYDVQQLRVIQQAVAPHAGFIPIFNPPLSLGVLYLLSLLPIEIAFLGLSTLSILAALILPWILNLPQSTERYSLYFAALFTFIPAIVALRMGQLTLFMLGLGCLAWAALRSNRPVIGGLLLSPLLVKTGPFFVFLATLSLLGIRKFSWRFALSLSWVPLLSLLFLAGWNQTDWRHYTEAVGTAGDRIPYSLTGLIQLQAYELFESRFQSIRPIMPLVTIAILMTGVRRGWIDLNSSQGLTTLLLSSLLVAPFCYLFDLVLLIPVLFMIIGVAAPSSAWIVSIIGLLALPFLDAIIAPSLDIYLWSLLSPLWALAFWWSVHQKRS